MSNKEGVRMLTLAMAGLMVVLGLLVVSLAIEGQLSVVDWINDAGDEAAAKIEAAKGMGYPMNSTTALEAGLEFNNTVDMALFLFYGFLALYLMGAGIVVAGVSVFIRVYRRIPADSERIKSLEENQKTIVGQQDRILTILERKLQQDALKSIRKTHALRKRLAGQPRDRFGKFKKKGRRR